MRKHLKLAALTLVCMMVISITGCSPAAETTPTAPVTPSAPAPETPAPETPAPQDLEPSAMYRGHNSGLTTRTAAEGYYVQYLGFEDLGEAIFGPLSHEGSEVSCFQVNSLVLTNNEFASRGNCQFS